MSLKKLAFTIAALSGFFIVQFVYSLTTNYKNFTDGSVLTAAELNNLQTNYTNGDNAILNGDTFTGNMSWHSGSDALFYSNTGSTLTVGIYGDSGKIIGANLTYGQVNNCGLSISGSTLSVTDASGAALSSTNPCYVVGENTTGGTLKVNKFATPQTVTFGATSDTDGNLFGITDANWAYVMPMFVGVITDGTNSYFTLSRVPVVVTSSAATALCQKGDTDCDAQSDVFIATTGLTLSSWTSKPIVQIGWLKATYATTGGAWTFTLGAKTGFNTNYESVTFLFPEGQNGASTGTYFGTNGPSNFDTPGFIYKINKSGQVKISVSLSGLPTNGTDALTARLYLPYAAVSDPFALDDNFNNMVRLRIGDTDYIANVLGVAGSYITFKYFSTITTESTLLNNNFSGDDWITFSLIYSAM